ncbi:hypothetical protein ASE26_25560 [Duganella sp. Root198D2]|nr:hypothetical protein ASE26_25560 [Duganella sp. Root198D2]
MFRKMIFILLLVSNFVHAAEKKCLVAGEAVHWQADYCMYKVGTDDFFHEDVQACMGKEEQKPQKSSCAAKIGYKKKICGKVADAERYNGSAEKCFQDADFSGPTVRNGGV